MTVINSIVRPSNSNLDRLIQDYCQHGYMGSRQPLIPALWAAGYSLDDINEMLFNQPLTLQEIQELEDSPPRVWVF